MNGMSRFTAALLSLCALACWPTQATARDACMDDPRRAHELRVLDEAQVTDMMDSFEVIAVPERLHRMLARLVAASPRLRNGPAIHLLAFDDRELNAYAADHGLVILTSALWGAKENLSDDELAAVIAHELAHIERRDSLAEACAHLQRLKQPDLRIEEARERMGLEMLNPYSHLAREARRELHEQEHNADLRGIELLRRTGRNPQAMVSVLAKLHGNGTPGLNLLMGSTHPDVRERLQRAQAAADAGHGPSRAARLPSR
jgi:Zn-dependent protease with chaperone function